MWRKVPKMQEVNCRVNSFSSSLATLSESVGLLFAQCVQLDRLLTQFQPINAQSENIDYGVASERLEEQLYILGEKTAHLGKAVLKNVQLPQPASVAPASDPDLNQRLHKLEAISENRLPSKAAGPAATTEGTPTSIPIVNYQWTMVMERINRPCLPGNVLKEPICPPAYPRQNAQPRR